MITVKRETTESIITVTLDSPPVKEGYRSAINTPMPFLNHMIEHIVWRSALNIGVSIETGKLTCPCYMRDVGMTIGKAVLQYTQVNRENGISGYGDGVGIIDEARATAAISFESRSLFVFDSLVDVPSQTEGTLSKIYQHFLTALRKAAHVLYILQSSGVPTDTIFGRLLSGPLELPSEKPLP